MSEDRSRRRQRRRRRSGDFNSLHRPRRWPRFFHKRDAEDQKRSVRSNETRRHAMFQVLAGLILIVPMGMYLRTETLLWGVLIIIAFVGVGIFEIAFRWIRPMRDWIQKDDND